MFEYLDQVLESDKPWELYDETDAGAMEAILDVAMEEYDMAMEGATMDAIKVFRQHHKEFKALKKEMNKAAKAKDYKLAAEKANACAAKGDDIATAVAQIPSSTSSAIIVNIALIVMAMVATGAVVGAGSRAVQGVINDKGIHPGKYFEGPHKKVFTGADHAERFVRKYNRHQFAQAAKQAGKRAAIGAGIGAAAGAASGGAGTALMQALKNKKLVDENGNPTGEKANANDINMIIRHIQKTAKKISENYRKKAQKYSEMASSATESFMEGMEAFYGRPIDSIPSFLDSLWDD